MFHVQLIKPCVGNMFDQAQAGALQCQTTIPWTSSLLGVIWWGAAMTSFAPICSLLNSCLFFHLLSLCDLCGRPTCGNSLRRALVRMLQMLVKNCSSTVVQCAFCPCSPLEGPKVMLVNAQRLDVSWSRTYWNHVGTLGLARAENVLQSASTDKQPMHDGNTQEADAKYAAMV